MREREAPHHHRFSPSRFVKNLAIAGVAALGIAEGATAIRSAVIEDQRLDAIVREYPQTLVDPSFGLVIADDSQELSVPFGVSPDQNNINEVLELTDQYGISVSSVNFFLDSLDGTEYLIDSWIQQSCARNLRPMISWGNVRYIHEFEVYESQIRSFAQQLASYDCIIEFRMFYEMNADWFNYGSSSIEPTELIEGWRIIHNIFKEEHASNVLFVFSPNSTINAQPIENYYPGDDYVDIVSLDIYNKYDHVPFRSLSHYIFPNVSAEAMIGPDLQSLRRIAPNKLIYITELGILYEEQNYQWFREAIEYLMREDVTIIMVFSWNKHGVAWDEHNWRIQDNFYVLAVIQDYFSDNEEVIYQFE